MNANLQKPTPTEAKPKTPTFLGHMFEEMDRFWDRPMLTLPHFDRMFRRFGKNTPWLPKLDAFEQNGELIVKAELPGMKKEQVEVLLEEGDLILRGERREEMEVKEENYYRAEREIGSFYRSLPLPFAADPAKVVAKFVDGVLEVHIPMPPEAKKDVATIPVH